MRKFMLLGALVAVVVAALALPALAHNRNNDLDNRNSDLEEARVGQEDAFEAFLADFYTFYGLDNERMDERWDERWDEGDQRWEERNDRDWWNDWRDDWRDDERNNDEVVPAVEQSFEQQAESGDVNQSFNVSNTGDNSNQCAGIQGVANTGNAQNQVGIIQYGSEAEDFEFEDVGSTITVSPSNSTSCDQRVNQAASAFGR